MTEKIDKDILCKLLETMSNNVGLRLTGDASETEGETYKVEKITIEHLKELGRRKDKLNIICLLLHSSVGEFCAALEHTHYKPGEPENDDFTTTYFKWNDLLFVIITIPFKDKSKVDDIAKKVGARLTNNVPTLIGGDDPKFNFGGIAPAEMFPLNNPQTFNLETK